SGVGSSPRVLGDGTWQTLQSWLRVLHRAKRASGLCSAPVAASLSQKDARSRFEERWTQVGADLDPTLPLDATIRSDTLRRLFAGGRERGGLAADQAPPSSVAVDPAVLPPISISFADAEGAAGDPPPCEGEHHADLAIMGLLGEGGMGAVYVARQRAL